MKGMATTAALVGMTLLGSCSWLACTKPTFTAPAADTEQVEPTPEQQEAAMQLLQKISQEAEEKPKEESPVVEEPRPEVERSVDEDEEEDDGSLPDPAEQRGLRSPALPKLLPMDINGKLNPGL